MRVLLVGGSGQLGTEIRRWNDCEIVAPPHGELDLEDSAQLAAAIERSSPDVLINAAAFHNVDRCEEEPERAFAVNALAVDRAARLCSERDVRFVTISTDYVFDGTASQPYTEADPARPISTYGISKLTGEFLTLRAPSRALVVRTCGVYGVRPSASKGYTFIDRVIAQARNGEPMRIVRDVVASPTFAGHLAFGLRELLRRDATGLYHVANPGPVSWYAFACEALAQAGVASESIEPITAADWKTGARRPRFSALADAGLRELGIAIPSWRDGIAAYLKARGEALTPAP